VTSVKLDSACGSGAMFAMYPERAEDDDDQTTERWKADANGILVFVSGHSAITFSLRCQPL
jgi:hypothetical protein